MLRFCANLSILFTELSLLDRPAAAAAAGFDAAELWWPFPEPVPPEGALESLAESLAEAGLRLVGLNLDGGDLAAGERGLVSLPGMDQRFADNLDCAVAFAASQGVRVMNALYGNRDGSVAPERQDEIALERLASAATAAEAVGIQVVIETQNHLDSPGYPLRQADQVAALVDQLRAAGHDNVGLLCDFYHLAMEGADLQAVWRDHAPIVLHTQVADAPGRHEPGTGKIDYPAVLSRLAASGYSGYVGCEYRPATTTEESLDWLAAYRRPGPAAPEAAPRPAGPEAGAAAPETGPEAAPEAEEAEQERA